MDRFPIRLTATCKISMAEVWRRILHTHDGSDATERFVGQSAGSKLSGSFNEMFGSLRNGTRWGPRFKYSGNNQYSTLEPNSHVTDTKGPIPRPCWDANCWLPSQQILRLLRNPKVHYQAIPTFIILDQMNQIHTPTPHFYKFNFNIIFPSTPESSWWSPSLKFPYEDYVLFPTHATCPAYFMFLDLVIAIIFGDKYKLWKPFTS